MISVDSKVRYRNREYTVISDRNNGMIDVAVVHARYWNGYPKTISDVHECVYKDEVEEC